MSGLDLVFLPEPGYVLADGTRLGPGFVDRNAYPEIPEAAFYQTFVLPAPVNPDVARLKALIKAAEWDGQRGRDADACCPWCQVHDDEKHLDTCPAFTPEGLVK